MSLEALGRTYRGGAPAPLRPGDLVTAVDAPEGVPTWVGVVTIPSPSLGLYREHLAVRRLGDADDSGQEHPSRIRPLSNAEVVAVAEMLMGECWRRLGGYRWQLHKGDILLLAYDDGDWCVSAPCRQNASDFRGPLFKGAGGDLAQAVAAASRALISYTIKGHTC